MVDCDTFIPWSVELVGDITVFEVSFTALALHLSSAVVYVAQYIRGFFPLAISNIGHSQSLFNASDYFFLSGFHEDLCFNNKCSLHR